MWNRITNSICWQQTISTYPGHMILRFDNLSVSPDIIWQELEFNSADSIEEELSQYHFARCGESDIFLGLVTNTGERTVHLRVPGSKADGFTFSFTPDGLWLKTIVFPDHTIIAIVLTDDAMRAQFSVFAHDLTINLSQATDDSVVLRQLTAQLTAWLPVPDSLRWVA